MRGRLSMMTTLFRGVMFVAKKPWVVCCNKQASGGRSVCSPSSIGAPPGGGSLGSAWTCRLPGFCALHVIPGSYSYPW